MFAVYAHNRYMRFVFWLSSALVIYAYVGYAALLKLIARTRTIPVQTGAIEPSISIILAAHNEERLLPQKLADLYESNYTPGKMEIVVASDGSSDRTNAILEQHKSRVIAVYLPQPAGKAVAINKAIEAASGEILICMDVRQRVDPDAISRLVACFADESVGAVSGELHLEAADGQAATDGLGVYWKLEKLVRKLESATGSVVGVTGALFAMRRDLFVPLPPGTLLDDVLTPLQIARRGKRILFLETAIARDRIFTQKGKEFGRKVRTLTGNYQLLQLAPWLLTSKNPLLFRLISHKLLRLFVPLLLLLMLFSSACVNTAFFNMASLLQLLLYGSAALGAASPAMRRFRAISIAYTFVMLNVAAAMAFYNFLGGRARWA